ncbi:oxygenase MpaB family protein [Luteolibacter sp. SL250]|uniref:oxygenase MpaB family protein n=1 Tax=Luteolibacter sp. SL250 TaxID=2995170 RepID=UPI0022705ACF|nr:oxygenase MpaB family protein [Luteolibacter sp. SL250]WAC20635.1 oxygenase MpaB family protein [Luteolibacter sp. SL250]
MPSVPTFLKPRLENLLRSQLDDGSGRMMDFTQPAGEPALVAADSISWRVFANPVTLVIGGITAVLLELAEPKVRSGVWDHTTFRTDPLKRMRRTGLAAMVTVYGARSQATRMISGVRRMHEQVRGTTPEGVPYEANDPELLRWVHATAAFGFLEAYHHYVTPLDQAGRDRYYAEGAPISRLYGAETAPVSEDELRELFSGMLHRLEPSGILSEFIGIMESLPLLPRPLRRFNRIFISASVGLLPPDIRMKLGLCGRSPSAAATRVLRFLARQAEGLELDSSPIMQARRRVDDLPRNPA